MSVGVHPTGSVVAGLIVCAAATLAACTSSPSAAPPHHPPHDSGPATTSTTAPPVTTAPTATTVPSATALPVAPIAWTACGLDEQCGFVTVPVSYRAPHGPTVRMALERHLAADPAHRIGSLVIDPGGPGGSGIDDMQNELDSLTPTLLNAFDVVLFDPRGVQRSDPFTCGSTSGNSASGASAPGDPVPTTAADRTAFFRSAAEYAQGCKRASGALLPNLGTLDVARDIERLRIALGGSKLYYMGQSYGTLIGEEYLELYPGHVAAMVLDSPIDPALGTDQFTADQAVSFERVLHDFFSWCAGTSACPWHTTRDPTAALNNLVTRSLTQPHGGYASPSDVYNAVLDTLYSPNAWPSLGDALAADEAGSATSAGSLASSYNTSNSTNSNDAFIGVNCLDHPVSRSVQHWGPLATSLARTAPFFGPLFAWGEAQCAVWPALPTRAPGAITGHGGPPVLVVGTTGDPATPYRWAVDVAHQLSGAALVTFQGDYHVAYFYSACVRASIDAYFVHGTVPARGTVCAN